MKVIIQYPVISFERIEIDMDEEKYNEVRNLTNQEQAKFIREQVSIYKVEDEDWIHSDLESALEVEYASIKCR